MQWFGESWNAPICRLAHTETPVGRPCMHCHKPITETDIGLVIPYYGEAVSQEPWHLGCFKDSLGLVEDAS